jgi:hypothetical protein
MRSFALRILLVALASVALLTLAQAASAGTYTVSACSPTTSPGGWQPVDTFPSGLTVGNMCGGPATGPNEPQAPPTDEGALFAQDTTDTTADIPNGAEAGWSFTAPTGTTIVGLSYYRSLHAHQEPDLIPGLWAGEGATIESCPATFEDHYECNMLNNQPPLLGALNTSSLFFGVRCNLLNGGEYCVAAAPGERHAQADLYSANVTLSEASLPTIASVAGAGWGGGVIFGQVPLMLTADDPSGIANVEVRSSLGAVLASAPQSCEYYLAVPCPELSGTMIELDTTAAPEGPQSLILTVRDAAGNVSNQTSPLLVIDNHPPAPPTGETSPPVVLPPPPSPGGGKAAEKLHALIDSHGRLYVTGPVPKGVRAVRVCWHSKRGKRTLSSRCVTLHVRHDRIAVTFHPSARARRGHITVTISKGQIVIAHAVATQAGTINKLALSSEGGGGAHTVVLAWPLRRPLAPPAHERVARHWRANGPLRPGSGRVVRVLPHP